jgi:uncharacterized protein (TIGR00661 family)
MTGKKFNSSVRKSRVLIAPLDWGLGHATRCIPVIQELLANDCEVIVAAENATKSLLQNEFPQLHFLSLDGYGIQYSRTSSLFPLKILMQFPKLFFSVYKEHRWLKKAVKDHEFDAVISDNRFGLYTSAVPCIYITHQLLIKTGSNFTEKIAQKIHYYFIKKYKGCWVPDFDGTVNVAGELSHPQKKLSNIIYLGCLSRFEKKLTTEKKYELIVLISGPEPQRTIFENLLLDQLQEYKSSVLLVRGLPNVSAVKQTINEQIKIVNHLSSDELSAAIQQSNYVISRSGYTTVMDLIKLQQKAIFVPTPGQTEQEYLAKHLAKQKIFFYAEQKKFLLADVIKQAEKISFTIPEFDMSQYKKVIQQFVESIKK